MRQNVPAKRRKEHDMERVKEKDGMERVIGARAIKEIGARAGTETRVRAAKEIGAIAVKDGAA